MNAINAAHQLTTIEDARRFVLGGNAYFTVVNSETGNRLTYRVAVDKDDETVHNVYAFTGTENSLPSNYSPVGYIKDGKFCFRGLRDMAFDLKAAAKDANNEWLLGFAANIIGLHIHGKTLTARQQSVFSKACREHNISEGLFPASDLRVRAFAWLWNTHIAPDRAFPSVLEFWTEGRCAKCARRLTVPSSIAVGFGPICADLLHITLDTSLDVVGSNPPATA